MLVATLIAAYDCNLHLKNRGLRLIYGFSTLSGAFFCKLSPKNYRDIYGWPTISLAYVCKLYLKNHWVTLNLRFSILRFSLCFSAQPMIVSSTYKVTELHYTFNCATLSVVYICNPSLQN